MQTISYLLTIMRTSSDNTASSQTLLQKNIWLSGYENAIFANQIAHAIFQTVPKLHNKPINILDFGCGDGLLTSFVQEQFPQACIVGIDQSSEHIEVATMAYESIYFTATRTPADLADNTFDCIIVANALHHISDAQHATLMHHFNRILTHDGIIIIVELNPLNIFTNIAFRNNPLENNAHMLTPWYTRKLLQPYGTVTTHYDYFSHQLTRVKSYLQWLPFSGIYMCCINKR